MVRGLIQRFPRAVLAISSLSAYGMKRHGSALDEDHLVVLGDAKGQRLDAQGRHLCMEAIDKDGMDAESEHHHATATAWNALAYLELLLKEAEAGFRKKPNE